jgi:multidrug efflux pump subunit AcrA (membrane-fusion protein)
MSLTLNQPEDLKVKQGDRVVSGQIIVERQPTEQQRLTRIQLVGQINAIARPHEEIYLVQANQEVEIAQAQLKSYKDSSPFTAAAPVPLSRLVKEQELESQLAAAANKRNAIASQLEIARQEFNIKRGQLQLQLKALDAEAQQLLKVKSPYNGVIRRVKVERGSNRQMTVTLVIQSAEVQR